jgi:hypothetical protein
VAKNVLVLAAKAVQGSTQKGVRSSENVLKAAKVQVCLLR